MAMDEEGTNPLPWFSCTAEEYASGKAEYIHMGNTFPLASALFVELI
jgi:hypothetical protein